MKVLSTILALVVLPIGFNSAPAETDLAPSELPTTIETKTSTLSLPPFHWIVYPKDACNACHQEEPPIPGAGQSSDLEELFGSWAEADRLKTGD